MVFFCFLYSILPISNIFMPKSFLLKIVLFIVFVMFLVAVAMIIWFFYMQQSVDDGPAIVDVVVSDPFENLSEKEADRKALELLTPQVQENQQTEDSLSDLELLLGGSAQGSAEVATSSTSSSDNSSFFDNQTNRRPTEQVASDLEALLSQ